MGHKRTSRMAGSPQHSSLLRLLELSQCECLNEKTPNSLQSLLRRKVDKGGVGNEEAILVESSNEDPQLLISLGFSVPVRLTSLKLRAPLGALEAGEAPQRLRLFLNDPNKSFADAEADPATDEFDVPTNETVEAGVTLPLKSVRYKSVSSLQIFVERNGGAPATKISDIDVLGLPTDSLQMKDWKPLKPDEAIAVNDT